MIVEHTPKNESDKILESSEPKKVRRSEMKKMSLNPTQSYNKYLELPLMTKDGIS